MQEPIELELYLMQVGMIWLALFIALAILFFAWVIARKVW